MALTFSTLSLAAVPLKFVVPVALGLAAGSGAVAAYVATPNTPTALSAPAEAVTLAALPSPSASSPTPASEATASERPASATKRPCEQQTWPYIDGRCVAGSDKARDVRFVTAPRVSDVASDPNVANTVPSPMLRNLVTSDTVLRGPQAAREAAPAAEKRSAKRESRRDRHQPRYERRWAAQSYDVPTENSGRRSRAVVVVRPDFFR